MAIIVDAIYENGVLKPDRPLPLDEHEKVQITLHTAVSRVHDTYGIIGWKGDGETVQRAALDAEFGISESA